MNKEELIESIKGLGINPTETQLQNLEIFLDCLLEENLKTNLTAIKDKENSYLKHVYDSLTIVKVLHLKDNILYISKTIPINNILDIGTGPGFPGIILKIFFPALHVTLLDSNNKKTKFLEKVTKNLGLTKINIINSRAEEYVVSQRESFDLVTSRAVARLNILLELAIPFVRPGGLFIAMKGRKDHLEEQEGKAAAKLLQSSWLNTLNFSLPKENSERTLYQITKSKPTSKLFPRRYEQIIKNPLKKKEK